MGKSTGATAGHKGDVAYLSESMTGRQYLHWIRGECFRQGDSTCKGPKLSVSWVQCVCVCAPCRKCTD